MAAMPGQFSGIYEALLDSFSPDMKDATIAREFAMLERELPSTSRKVTARGLKARLPDCS